MTSAFSRTELLLGPVGLQRLSRAKVAIFGVGGVGSYAAEALARCGVGRFVLVDSDTICLTNINRQIHALRSTVGMAKVEAMRARMLDIHPDAEIECVLDFYMPGKAEGMLTPDLDYVLDCIDTVTSKIDLIVECGKRNIPIISAMGAGNKLDPTRFEVTDIYRTSECPLARVMRKELRARGVEKLKVVYSREPAIRPVLIEDDSSTDEIVCRKGAPGDKSVRRQIPGSVSFVPSVAGLIMAGEVVKELVGPCQ